MPYWPICVNQIRMYQVNLKTFAFRLTLLASLCVSQLALATAQPITKLPSWAVGFWKISYNEDALPPDTFELTADGHYVSQGMHCDAHYLGDVHVYKGEFYVRGVIPGKGPVAFLLVPNEHHQLAFTSTRTGNNSVYSKLPGNPCGENDGTTPPR